MEDSGNNSDEIDNESEEDIDDDDKKKNNDDYIDLGSTSSREALNHIEQQIFGNTLEPKKPTPSTVNIASLNNLAQPEHLLVQEPNNQYTLMNHLCNIVALDSFKEAQNLVDIMYEEITPQKRTTIATSNAEIFLLEQEKKQRRQQSYKS
ncbi:1420_t:CDS:2, partial [Dentiscutata heterogama]